MVKGSPVRPGIFGAGITPVSKWLRSPLFITHLGHLEGVPQPQFGDENDHHGPINHVSKSWDDPPKSRKSYYPKEKSDFFPQGVGVCLLASLCGSSFLTILASTMMILQVHSQKYHL